MTEVVNDFWGKKLGVIKVGDTRAQALERLALVGDVSLQDKDGLAMLQDDTICSGQGPYCAKINQLDYIGSGFAAAVVQPFQIKIVERITGQVFRVTTPQGSAALKIVPVQRPEPPDPIAALMGVPAAPLGTRYEQLRNEISVLTGALANCVGCPKVVSWHEGNLMLFMAEQPLGECILKVELPDDDKKRCEILFTWARQVADTLNEIHTRGILYRDMKPENLIIADGKICLIDFGLAISNQQQQKISTQLGDVCFQGGTKGFTSANFDNCQPVGPLDDFESLAYTMHALRMGVEKWKTITETKKPTVEDLCKLDPFVASIYQLSSKYEAPSGGQVRAGALSGSQAPSGGQALSGGQAPSGGQTGLGLGIMTAAALVAIGSWSLTQG